MNDKNQKEKADYFLKLHQDKEILVLLNSWDPGSSRLIEACGFKAIATTSMGISASLGYPDCQVILFQEMLEAISRITAKVKLPVTVDIEGGFGKTTEQILDSIRNIIETGVVGINIEDNLSLNPQLVDEKEFCERISAIRDLSYSLGFHLVINARTDVFLTASGSPNSRLSEAIRRGNIYKEAGADCIFVPNVWERDKITFLVKEINAPVNILVNPTNGTGLPPAIKELENMGVSRVSTGSSVMKSTLALANKIALEMLLNGTYDTLTDAVTPLPDTLLAYKMATGTVE
jgi:2-methylisocitrate lyase-like PEP mutase family enzyme